MDILKCHQTNHLKDAINKYGLENIKRLYPGRNDKHIDVIHITPECVIISNKRYFPDEEHTPFELAHEIGKLNDIPLFESGEDAWDHWKSTRR